VFKEEKLKDVLSAIISLCGEDPAIFLKEWYGEIQLDQALTLLDSRQKVSTSL
jgi:hypothetical protein